MPENENEESLTRRQPTIQISEVPGKAYGVTMEVPIFLTMLGISLGGAAISNLLLFRTCVHSLGHSVEECKVFLKPHSNETIHFEVETQRYATFVGTVRMIIESGGPAILSFFLGVWSDTHGRKPLVVWPLLGMSLSAMLTVVYSMLDNLGPWWYILTAIPFSLTGGYTVLFTGAFCYLSDITTTSNRSLRMTILEAMVSVASVLGSLMSSYILGAVGPVYLLLIAAVLYVMAYCFTNIWVRESLTGAIEGGITTVLDLLLVKEMMRECFKRRPNHMRAQILLLTVANSITILILYGTIGLEYMYTREKLNWALREYTIYSAVSTAISFVGCFVGIGLMQKVFRVTDLACILVAFVSATIEFVIKTLAVQSWHMYLGAGISMFKGLSAPLIRSMLTKILPVEDIAKVFSLMCAIEGICPLISPAAYNSLYAFTISSFPGAIYVLSAVFTTACTVMLGYVQYYRWKPSTPAYQPLEEEL